MKKFISIILLALTTTAFGLAQDLTVGSYNIRCYNDIDIERGDGWERRKPVVAQLILFNDFDLFGAQEVVHNQLMDMVELLPHYGYVGIGRDDGKTGGEYSPVFYKKERFELLDEGTFWLSTTPDVPSKGWDAALPRVCSWAKLLDKEHSKKLWFFNLHMDHIGVEARRESAKLVLEKITEMCGDETVILTGDFNVDQTNESYLLLENSSQLSDCYESAEICYAFNGTFNDFQADGMSNSRIDHIFVSNDLKVDRYGILTDTYRTPIQTEGEEQSADFPEEIYRKKAEIRLPSDHFPIKVMLYYR